MNSWMLLDTLGPEARAGFASLDSVFALEGELVARSPISRVLRVTLDGKVYYVKRYVGDRPGIRSWFGLRTLVAPIRVKREWENLAHFTSWGIPAAQVVACGLYRKWGIFQRGALITAEIPRTESLSLLARQESPELADRAWVAEVSRQLAGATRIMHAHHFVHNDLKWRNLLVNDSTPPTLSFIDCPTGGFWWGPFLTYRRIKDLACLDKLGKYHLSRSQRLRFYLDYADHKRLTPGDKKTIRRVLDFFRGRE
jgi:hypothetical protein